MIVRRKWLPLKVGFFSRSRLDALLEEGVNSSLVTIVAGSGYGKTSAAAAFAKKTDKRVVWMHATRYNNDTTRFWEVFVRAVKMELPGLGAQLEKMKFPSSAGSYEEFLHLFSKEVYDGEEVIIFVDDYDNLVENEVQNFFRLLMEARLENICLVLISGRKTDMNVAGLKSLGGLFSITASDLKFTEQETRDFFRFHEANIPSNAVGEIFKRTEGWPLSLNLLALHYRNRPFDLAEAKSHVTLAFELFEMEYFSGFEPEIQQLLIKLSFFTGFSLEMVKAIGGCDLAKATEVITNNMFIKYDHPARLFVFQNLYREYLSQLSFMLDRSEIDRIYRVGGDWFLQNDLAVKAIDCYHECGDYDRILLALQALPKQRKNRELTNHMLHILYQLPPEYARENMLVDVSIALFLLNNMEVERARSILLDLVQRLEPEQEQDAEKRHFLGEVFLILGDIAFLQNTEDFADYYKKANQCIRTHSLVRDKDTLLVGSNSCLFLTCNRPGEVERIEQQFMECSTVWERISNGNAFGVEFLYAAESALYRLDLERAKEYAYKTIYKAQEKEQHDLVLNAYLVLMKIGFHRGDCEDARQHLDLIRKYVQDIGVPQLFDMRDCAESWFYIHVNDLKKTPQWLQNYDSHYIARFPIDTGRNRMMYPLYLMAQNKFHEALAAMMQMDHLYKEKGLWAVRLMISIMKALCHMQIGDIENAEAHFWEAYDMSWQNGLIMHFIEFGNTMRTMIAYARKSTKYSFDPNWLDTLYEHSTAFAKLHAQFLNDYYKGNQKDSRPAGKVKLTKRELEILNYFAKGMTREEIADKVGISLNGVKKHITGIYNKLGAVNRADAVRLATIIGIIE